MPKVSRDGVSIHYEVEGSGPPLLLIMGLGGSRLGWAATVPRLTDRFTVITFDNRGTGESDVPPGPYTIDELGDDAAALVEHLGLGPVAAVGLSLGGTVLQSMLIRHGRLLTKAVLLSTLARYTELQHRWLDGNLALRSAGVAPEVSGAFGLPWAFTPRLLADHDAMARTLALMAKDPMPTSFEGFAAQAQAIRTYDALPHLHAVTTPTLVLVGAEDVLTPPSQSIEIAREIPGARLVVLPRGGHGMFQEYADDTLAQVVGFLS